MDYVAWWVAGIICGVLSLVWIFSIVASYAVLKSLDEGIIETLSQEDVE